MRVFGHTTESTYSTNPDGYEFVSENGGEPQGRTNREVCLPDSLLLDPHEITRIASATRQSEHVVRSHILHVADAWMHNRGAHVDVRGAPPTPSASGAPR
jgi:hypothetical protein